MLSTTHPAGRHKAAFFEKLGFSRVDWGSLADTLRDQALTSEATELEASPYGRKFEVTALIGGQEVISVWIILRGEEAPRLITAYPGGTS